jgi:hypothetical protein
MMRNLRCNGLTSHFMVSHTVLVLSRVSLISALTVSACFRLRRVVLHARYLHRPACALTASCNFRALPRNLHLTWLTHGSFLLLACALHLATISVSVLTTVIVAAEAVCRYLLERKRCTILLRCAGFELE